MITAQEIADALFDHPAGATPERLAKAMALAERSRRAGAFKEALQVGLEARGLTIETATLRAAALLRNEALEQARLSALRRKDDDPRRPALLAHFEQALTTHAALMATLA